MGSNQSNGYLPQQTHQSQDLRGKQYLLPDLPSDMGYHCEDAHTPSLLHKDAYSYQDTMQPDNALLFLQELSAL